MEEPRVSSGRYFCYSCRTHVHSVQDFKCPLCSGGFIELVEGEQQPPAADENASSQNTPRPATTRQFTDVGIDESPPWNYSDDQGRPAASANTNNPMSFTNDLGFMPGDRIRPGRFNTPESLLQEVMWQVTGGMIGVPPLLLVGSNRNDYIMSNEDIDIIMSQLLWHSDNDGPPPLAQDIIDSLPETAISEEQTLSKLQCSVCWELYNFDEKVRQLKCGHIYHKECISPWLALHATCPICRQSLQPENSGSEARSTPPREPEIGQTIRVTGNAPTTLAALLFRACRDNGVPFPGDPASTASAPANPAPSSSVPFSPAPADAAPNTSATSEFSGFSNMCDNATPPMSTETTSTTETPVNQTTTNPTPNQPQRLGGNMPPGINHIVLMASPQQGADRNNISEYSIAFWSNFPPLSSPAVSSTTSDVNSGRSPANFDMDLE